MFVRRTAIVKKDSLGFRDAAVDEGELDVEAADQELPAGGFAALRSTTADGAPRLGSPPTQAPEPPPPPAPSAAVLEQQILEDANRRAEAVLRQAQMEAKRLVEESKVYCQQAAQEAQQAGLEQGRQQGYEEARRETIEHVLQARSMFVQAVAAREMLLRSLQPEIARLALKVAERIMSTSLSIEPELVNAQICAALDRVKEREHIKVQVHADDLAVARANREVFLKLLEGQKSFDIVADAKVDRGGCMIESNQGNVDARIQTQLGALRLAFEEIERREHEELEAIAAAAAAEAERLAAAQSPLASLVTEEAPTFDPAAFAEGSLAEGGTDGVGEFMH